MSYGTAIRDPLRYGFAVGRVRVLETKLLKRSHFERLLAAADFEEQHKILSETVYGAYLEGAKRVDDVERALERVLGDLHREFLCSANLPAEIAELFGLRDDYEEVRGLLKAQAHDVSPAELLGGTGASSVADLVAGKLPSPLAAVYQRLRAVVSDGEGNVRADMVDMVVDRDLHERIRALADKSHNRFVQQMASVFIDLANVRVFVRTRLKGLTVTDARDYLLEGGSISLKQLLSLYRLPLEEAAARLVAYGPLRGVDPEALVDTERLDVVSDAIVAKITSQARMVAVGPEPVVAYVLARRAEVAMVRTLLIGKLAGVSTEVLRVRLRDVVA